jgi:DNA-directed RNA polymerase subunit M/transcription elongation factor TFIIS
MYYSLEDNKPIAVCASCDSRHPVSNPVICMKEFNQQMTSQTPITNFTKLDRTLQRTFVKCPQCNEKTEFCLFKKDRNGRLGQICTQCNTMISLVSSSSDQPEDDGDHDDDDAED